MAIEGENPAPRSRKLVGASTMSTLNLLRERDAVSRPKRSLNRALERAARKGLSVAVTRRSNQLTGARRAHRDL